MTLFRLAPSSPLSQPALPAFQAFIPAKLSFSFPSVHVILPVVENGVQDQNQNDNGGYGRDKDHQHFDIDENYIVGLAGHRFIITVKFVSMCIL